MRASTVFFANRHYIDSLLAKLGGGEVQLRGDSYRVLREQHNQNLRTVPSWLGFVIGGAGSLLAACDECKDSQVGKIWCEGAVRIECRAKAGAETVHHNVRVVFDDCGARGLACIQSGRDSWCGFSEVSCEDKPEEFCEDNWRVSCAGGRAHPAAVMNCESGSPGEKYCVERADDAICSGFDDHCNAGEPPRCINSAQFECIQGAWEVVSAKVCPQTDAASP